MLKFIYIGKQEYPEDKIPTFQSKQTFFGLKVPKGLSLIKIQQIQYSIFRLASLQSLYNQPKRQVLVNNWSANQFLEIFVHISIIQCRIGNKYTLKFNILGCQIAFNFLMLTLLRKAFFDNLIPSQLKRSYSNIEWKSSLVFSSQWYY